MLGRVVGEICTVSQAASNRVKQNKGKVNMRREEREKERGKLSLSLGFPILMYSILVSVYVCVVYIW